MREKLYITYPASQVPIKCKRCTEKEKEAAEEAKEEFRKLKRKLEQSQNEEVKKEILKELKKLLPQLPKPVLQHFGVLSLGQKVEVIKLENEYNPRDMLYNVQVVIKCRCKSCGIQIQEVAPLLWIPVEILKEAWGKCPKCGSEMNLQNEKINQKSSKEEEMTDIIEVSGEMICSKCSSKLPLSKKMQIRFRPIWDFIKEIKKIKIGKEGIEFER